LKRNAKPSTTVGTPIKTHILFSFLCPCYVDAVALRAASGGA
jgi:hypothetical protein